MKVDIKKTVEKILENDYGFVDVENLNKQLEKPDAQEFIIDVCTFLEIEPIYELN